MANFVLYDVGANWGHDSLPRTAADPNVICHAFEPTLQLIQYLYKESWAFSDRYHIHPVALSDFDGGAKFHMSTRGDWGVSSLNTFSPNIAETWSGRTDLVVDASVDVAVWRLETLFRRGAVPIVEIDFFHCDVQGSDLKVLQGMGDFVVLIKEGVIEVPDDASVKLYNEQHTKEEALDFLSSKGFDIANVTHQMNEQNLFFKRR